MNNSPSGSLNSYDWKKTLHNLLMLLGATALTFIEAQLLTINLTGVMFLGLPGGAYLLGLNHLLIYIGKRYFTDYSGGTTTAPIDSVN